jgi:hypothetical protein
MSFGHKYELLKEGAEGAEEPQSQVQHTQTPVTTSWWKFLLCNLLAAAVGAGVTFVIARNTYTSTPSSNTLNLTSTTAVPAGLNLPSDTAELLEGKVMAPNMAVGEILDCGWSTEEARAKNCVYDVMMQDWVPEPCYDAVLTEKYLTRGNWTWYADGDGKTTISDEVMQLGEHGSAWMATSYHHAHCVFSWVKLVRALRNHRGISQELLSYDHVLHCSHGALMEDPHDEGVGVSAPTNYAKCALFETWQANPLPDKHNSTGKV